MNEARLDRAATLVDVARRAKVSVPTASRVLNGGVRGSESGSPALRQRVQDAADELGYAVSTAAQTIKGGRSRTVAIIVSSIDNIGATMMIAGAMHAAEERGASIAVRATQDDAERELKILSQLRGERHQAVIMATSRTKVAAREAAVAKQLDILQRQGARVVVVGESSFPFATVTVDTRAAGRRLARGLVDAGHRRFAVISGPSNQVTANDRTEGFIAGLNDVGIVVPDDLIVHTEFSRDGGLDAVRRLGSRLHDVDVVAGMSDAIAIGAIAGIRQLGLSMPADVIVTGFDFVPALSDVIPGFSTVKVPLEDFGTVAVSIALDENAESEAPRVTLPSTTIIEGRAID